MVTMSSNFTLPPVIRRFGKCGDWGERVPSSSASEISESASHSEVYRNEPRRTSSYGGAAATTGTEKVKSFVNGIVSPFTACWQPSEAYCVPGCTPDELFAKQPAIVSPHLDRVITYRDSRFEHEQDEYPYPPRHHRPAAANNSYHRPRHVVAPASAAFVSRREPAAIEADASISSVPASVVAFDKKKRSTDIPKPRANDILCGRGGSSNRHLGNIHFRELVAANKQLYVGLTKKQKMLVARKIVDAIHKTGGRFLAKDLDTGLFYDIGLPRSLEKTSQALREKHSNEMPVQPVEDEGIETSVESHQSVITNNTTTEASKENAENTPAAVPSSSKSTTKSSKNTEAPSLIIPPHLMHKFGSGKKGSGKYDGPQHALSPSRNYPEQSYENHHSPYPPSPFRVSPAGSTPSPLNPQSYRPVAGHPPHPHHPPRYPVSPVSSGGQYPPPHHYYHGRHPQTPPSYGRHGHAPDERYAYPPHGDYYPRPMDPAAAAAASRRPPHGMPPPTQYHRYPGHHPPPSRQHAHPVPVSPHPPSQGGGPPTRPGFGAQAAAPAAQQQLPPYRPSQQQHSPRRYYRSDGSSLALPPHDVAASNSRILYRTSKNGYVRSNTDVSPPRQRDLKRQRNDDGQTAGASDASLSSAVKHSLSLDERVVGRERERQQSGGGDSSVSSSGHDELISPSTILQTKSSSKGSAMGSGRSSPTEKKEDYSALSGLAALSTAAFLKLDEDEAKK